MKCVGKYGFSQTSRKYNRGRSNTYFQVMFDESTLPNRYLSIYPKIAFEKSHAIITESLSFLTWIFSAAW